jgi:hypothetical protein
MVKVNDHVKGLLLQRSRQFAVARVQKVNPGEVRILFQDTPELRFCGVMDLRIVQLNLQATDHRRGKHNVADG